MVLISQRQLALWKRRLHTRRALTNRVLTHYRTSLARYCDLALGFNERNDDHGDEDDCAARLFVVVRSVGWSVGRLC